MSLLSVLLSFSVSFPEQPDIQLQITQNETIKSEVIFIAPHENESVANQYLISKVKKGGGKFVVLKQQGKRLLELELVNRRVRLDPNRIFTEIGRRKTLKKLNPSLNIDSKEGKQATELSKKLAAFILENIGYTNNVKEKLTWVAVHNNTNGYDGDEQGGEGTISIIRYQKKLESGSLFLLDTHNAGKDEDNLFYINRPTDFERIKNDGWNAALENPIVRTDPNEDDGSLSVFASKSNIRYINIEAERRSKSGGMDHLKEKKSMIDYIFSLLADSDKKAK